MYGFAVNLIVSVSGHPWIINEMTGSSATILQYSMNLCKSPKDP